MRLRLFVVLAAIALAGVAGFLALGRDENSADPSPAYVAEHPVEVPETARTVMVSYSMPLPSAHERRLSAMLEKGSMPARPVRAEVLTDTDCAPDDDMISRCRNVMRLEDGSEVVLRHPHDMTQIPCLAPGEVVRLIPNSV
jgi:hypothetical protein